MYSPINNWTTVTAGLPDVKQRTIQDSLLLVQQGDIKMVYGTDSHDGTPCLINAIGAMVKDVSDTPSSNDHELVLAFDTACRTLAKQTGSTEQYIVTPLMAEILVRHFGTLKDQPEYLTELPESGISWTDVPDNVGSLLNEQG